LPRLSSRPRQPERRTAAEAVFINVPFDRSYERLLIALVAGLATLRLVPRSVLDVPASAADRLTRLKRLIRSCQYSVHDLSCRTARFNMPFELGLALGLHDQATNHNWVVLDHRQYSLKKALSDLDGYDVVHVHGRSPRRLLACLNDAFHQQGVGIGDLERVWRRTRKYASKNLRERVFTRHGFRSLTYAAATLARPT
jgi:hypothetical protein